MRPLLSKVWGFINHSVPPKSSTLSAAGASPCVRAGWGGGGGEGGVGGGGGGGGEGCVIEKYTAVAQVAGHQVLCCPDHVSLAVSNTACLQAHKSWHI